MNTTEQIVRNIADDHSRKTTGEVPVFIDPMTAIMIGKIVFSLVKALKACKSDPKEAATVAANPGRLEKAAVSRAVRKELGFGSRFLQRKKTQELTEAVLAQCKYMNTANMTSLYREN